MKRIALLLTLLLAGTRLYAQQQVIPNATIVRQATLTSAAPIQPTSSPWISERLMGVKSHAITWTTEGTVSTCSVKVQKSEDGTSWSDLIAAQTCTSASGTATFTVDVASYVRINATTLTGSGKLLVTYFGYAVGMGNASVASQELAFAAIGTTTDAKCLTTDTSACTLISLEKGVLAAVNTIAAAVVPVSSACAILSTASTNSTSCKGSSGYRVGWWLVNTTATLYYLRIYNTASAPTCSSATGFVQSVPIPASTTGAGIVVQLPNSVAFATGLGYCITASSGSTANDNAAAGVFGELLYN